VSASIDGLLTALAHSSAAAAVLVLLVLALQALFRPLLSPRWQCALWLIVIARLVPFSLSSEASLFNLLPRWEADAHSEAKSAAAQAPASFPVLLISPAASAPTTRSPSAPTDAPELPAKQGASDSGAFWTWSTVLFFGWFVGAAALGSYVVVASVSLSRSIKHLPSLEDPEVLARLEDCCRQVGLRRAPGLSVSESVGTPALHGLLRPRVLLPADFAARYSAEEQRFVFLHELAHVQRRDLWLNWLVTGLQVIHWFNPLVWYGLARWRADREIACDAAALEAAGSESRRAYGRTMLRLLQASSITPPRPGLVGIMEDQRQLRRRLKMIAAFTPARRPFAAAAPFALLAFAGLTDAQVAPATSPSRANTSVAAPAPTPPPQSPAGPHVLFLIDGSASLAEDVDAVAPSDGETTTDYRERSRTFPAPAPTAPGRPVGPKSKWHLAASLLEDQLNRLPVETDFHVAVFFDHQTASVGGRSDPNDRSAIPDALARFRQVVPRGAANLETAFGYVADTLSTSRPERIVLLTDGLPTQSLSLPDAGAATEAQRVASFQAGTKKLPPRIPVHIVLLPRPPGDPTAVGHFWQLAHATGGGLTVPANPARAPRTHLAFVIDTSGSMRNPDRGALWPAAIRALDAALDLHPQLVGLQLLDGDGRFILGRRGTGASAWLAVTPKLREQIRRVLATYDQDTVSSPAPGIYNAMRFLHDRDAPDLQMGIFVLGDEFNAAEPAGVVLDRLDALNPRDVHGRRAVTINAIGFPTTIRYRFSMGNTGVRFANLMRLIVQAHDGEFTALADL